MQILEGKTDARRQKQHHMSSTNTFYVQGAAHAVGYMMVKKSYPSPQGTGIVGETKKSKLTNAFRTTNCTKFYERYRQWTEIGNTLNRIVREEATFKQSQQLFFPVVMYGCESWTVKKAEHRRINAFELWCWRRLLRVPWTAEIQPVHPKGDQSWVFFGRTDVEAETLILWPPDVKS